MNISSESSTYQMPCFTYVYSHQFVFPVVLNECQCILNTFYSLDTDPRVIK